jgi:hypothetical protein
MKNAPGNLIITLVVLMTSACAANETPSGLAAGDSGQAREMDGVNAGNGNLTQQAIRTLADFLSADPGEIRVHSVSPVEWPDGSLGCPKPGMSYPQVITPGHRALLQHSDRMYTVHMAGGRAFVCLPGGEEGPKMPVPRLTLSSEQVGKLAAMDLARRLGVEAHQVTVVSTRSVIWTDSSLGCPDESTTYQAGQIKGQVVELELNGRRYEYHAGLDQLIPCPPMEAQ